MARKRQHDELEGLYKSDLEFLIDEITVGALAYRNKEILKDTLIEGHSYRGSYDEGSMRGSYARGRGRNARRDSMGRYSSENEMMLEELQELMSDAPDDRTRQEIQKLVTRLEQM